VYQNDFLLISIALAKSSNSNFGKFQAFVHDNTGLGDFEFSYVIGGKRRGQISICNVVQSSPEDRREVGNGIFRFAFFCLCFGLFGRRSYESSSPIRLFYVGELVKGEKRASDRDGY